MADPLVALKKAQRRFAKARGWERYHDPKNIATALLVEAAELAEIFQWLTPAQSRALPPAKKVHAGEEIADVLLYLVRLADILGIDAAAAARAKIKKNALKYPAGRRGRSRLA
jgi:NTP pyrophosphatase (non-canonical NTP hydrolase)